jgi:hypothetical protein
LPPLSLDPQKFPRLIFFNDGAHLKRNESLSPEMFSNAPQGWPLKTSVMLTDHCLDEDDLFFPGPLFGLWLQENAQQLDWSNSTHRNALRTDPSIFPTAPNVKTLYQDLFEAPSDILGANGDR